MKKFTFRSLLVLVMVIGLAMVFVACPKTEEPANDTDGHDYKVTVIGVDGNPYTDYAVVEFCCSPAEEEGATCHGNSREINENGVAYADNGDDVLGDCTFTAHEIHVRGIPDTLRQKNELTIKKGESGIIYLEENIADFENGDGTAATPYGVKCYSNYKVKFTAADQKIYLAFSSNYAEIYKVYSIGSADVKIAQLEKTNDSFVAMGDEFANDNVSATDKNFSYQFTHKVENYTSYFEISLANGADINKDVIIVFEYLRDYIPESGNTEDGGNSDVSVAGKTFVFYDLTSDDLDAEEIAAGKAGNEGLTIVFGDNGTLTMTGFNSVLNVTVVQTGTYTQDGNDIVLTITSISVDGESQEVPQGVITTGTVEGNEIKLVEIIPGEEEGEEEIVIYTIFRLQEEE